MKKIFIILFIVSFSNSLFSQTIFYQKDKFDNSTSYIVSNKGMVLIDDDTEGVGFFILPDIENKNGTLSLKSVYGKVLGLNCLKAILIDIVFENEEKMTIKNEYNKFNCDGDYSISLSKKNLQQLKSNTISKIRFLNYSDGKMVTITKMSDSNKTFLKDVLENIEKVNNGLEIKEYVEN